MRLPLRYNAKSVLQRKVRSALTLAGVSLAVFVSVLMLALSRGMIASTRGSASPDNVIVLSKGAESMEFSAIDPGVFHLLRGSELIRKGKEGPLASPESYLSSFVRFPSAPELGERRGIVRGVWPVGPEVHDKIRIISGELPGRGFKVAVGRLAATKLGVAEEQLSLGRTVAFEGQTWTVAGIFEAPGTVLESEIWGHLDDVLVAAKRTDYSSVSLKVTDKQGLEDILFDLMTRTDIRVDAKAETDYYAAIARALSPVQVVAWVMTALLVGGGLMAGMNTMFTSVLGRTREMAVLIVMGYRRSAVLVSFILESVAISAVGGAVGVSAAFLLNGLPMKIPMGAFRFAVDGALLALGMGLAILIGIAGAAVPVAHVGRLRTVDALRGE